MALPRVLTGLSAPLALAMLALLTAAGPALAQACNPVCGRSYVAPGSLQQAAIEAPRNSAWLDPGFAIWGAGALLLVTCAWKLLMTLRASG